MVLAFHRGMLFGMVINSIALLSWGGQSVGNDEFELRDKTAWKLSVLTAVCLGPMLLLVEAGRPRGGPRPRLRWSVPYCDPYVYTDDVPE